MRFQKPLLRFNREQQGARPQVEALWHDLLAKPHHHRDRQNPLPAQGHRFAQDRTFERPQFAYAGTRNLLFNALRKSRPLFHQSVVRIKNRALIRVLRAVSMAENSRFTALRPG
jgi:hypothetical protein